MLTQHKSEEEARRCVAAITIMGISGLLPLLPSSSTWFNDFMVSIKKIGLEGETVGFDVAGLLFECARHHPDEYLAGRYDEDSEKLRRRRAAAAAAEKRFSRQ